MDMGRGVGMRKSKRSYIWSDVVRDVKEVAMEYIGFRFHKNVM